MATTKLDGAGLAKMTTLEEATADLQRLHGVVERCAMAVRAQQPASPFVSQVRRAGTPMIDLLKPQFGAISDQIVSFLLIASRGGGNDQTRVRILREGVAQIRVQLEIAMTKVTEQHAVEEEQDKKGEESDDIV